MSDNLEVGSRANRFAMIEPYVRDRTVLDIGCAVGLKRQDWLHRSISQVAKSAVGLDNDPERVGILNEQGYEIILGNAEDFSLEGRFDVVVAGELIEHLTNFRGFFDSVRAHLEPDGILVLTTPNPFAFSHFVRRLRPGAFVNPDHTCWFCEDTIKQLLAKCGYSTDRIAFIPHGAEGGGLRRRLALLVRKMLPDRLAWDGMLIIARPS